MNLSQLRSFRANIVDAFGRPRVNRTAAGLCRALGVDPMDVAFEMRGIEKFQTFGRSGELYFLESVLRPRLARAGIEQPLFIEVGANVGRYTVELERRFPGAQIHAFEPGEAAFIALQKQFERGAVSCHQKGCGRESATLELFTYQSEADSEHATLFADVFAELHKTQKVASTLVELVTLDEFCESNNIERCHFLKIDTEGNEMDVLRGARSLLERGAIDAIQFEFNAMNVVSRCFLRDFYQVLSDFELFRLDTNRLIPLPSYNPRDEIFVFQNFIALRRAA